jgi:phosphoglycolate phosphatase
VDNLEKETNRPHRKEFQGYHAITFEPNQKIDFFLFLWIFLKMLPFISNGKAFLFDFDGTLAHLNINFPALREEIILMAKGLGLSDPLLPEPPYLLELTQAFREQLQAMSPEKGELFYDKAMKVIEDRERQGARPENLFPYTRTVLSRIRTKKWKIAVLTRNSASSVYRVFPELDRYVDLFLPREKVVWPKPNPIHLTQAIQALEVLPPEAIMVGDHPIDIISGKKAGTRTVGVLTGRIQEKEMKDALPDLILPTIESLLELI